MTILLLAADPSTLTILAQRLGDVAGVRVIEERRRRPRRDPRQALPRVRDERAGRDRRVTPMLRGTFAVTEAG